MTNADPLPTTVLSRKAVVYVRQSTQTQLQVHRESQRRQYDLVEDARRGFRDVEVIDDDLGRSASGTVARPGFGGSSPASAPVKSAPSCASTPPAYSATIRIVAALPRLKCSRRLTRRLT
jgi:hypothetical protein